VTTARPTDPASGTIDPTRAQLERLAALDPSQPLVMVNLLRFKQQADGIDAADGISGAEAYGRYAAGVSGHLARVGGEVLLGLAAAESVIGPQDGEWDLVLAVRYPSPAAFLAMVTDAEYLRVHEHRAAALEDSRLIACHSVEA
jgi:uncharacterized protein (DUF1330 family)